MTAPAALRLPDGVREAAERLRQAMVIGESYSCSNEECIDCRAHDLLVALDAPAPEPDGKEKP